MTPERKRIADKIIKLLALASSTTFAAEAASARKLAQEMMLANNIDAPTGETFECREYVPFAKGMRWEGMIASALGRLCNCAVFFVKEKLDAYTLVGSKLDLDILDYMLREVNRQRIAAWLEYKGGGGADKFNSFCYAFAKALNEKTDKLLSSNYDQHHDTIVLWYETNLLGRKSVGSTLEMGAAKSEAGIAAGTDASLHRGSLGQPQKLIGKRPK
jgi:hypothetical protein